MSALQEAAPSSKAVKAEEEEWQEPELKKARVADDGRVKTEEEDEASAVLTHNVNDQGEAYFSLSSTRRATVRKFKKSILVDIREYYEKNGEMLPGKKGISLTTSQFRELAKAIKSGSMDSLISDLEEA